MNFSVISVDIFILIVINVGFGIYIHTIGSQSRISVAGFIFGDI